MNRRSALRTAITAAAVALCLTGCGSGTTEPDAATTTATSTIGTSSIGTSSTATSSIGTSTVPDENAAADTSPVGATRPDTVAATTVVVTLPVEPALTEADVIALEAALDEIDALLGQIEADLDADSAASPGRPAASG